MGFLGLGLVVCVVLIYISVWVLFCHVSPFNCLKNSIISNVSKMFVHLSIKCVCENVSYENYIL